MISTNSHSNQKNQKEKPQISNQIKEMKEKSQPKQCPYISTIKKNLLDFDFQKICSISLAHTNIYACLICGRYFQGRSPISPAYQHSIQFSHYVFMNLQNSKVYCLPDDYQVQSYTINDVKYNLKPVFTLQSLIQLQKMEEKQYNVDGKQFIPGAMGLNNLGRTDFASVVIYMLNAVKEIRHFFIVSPEFQSQLLNQFSTMLKKLWNPKSFKGIVSPHQFLQSVSETSNKKFKIGSQSDPSTFFLWLIDTLNKLTKKQKKIKKFQIQKLFKGKLKTSIIRGIKDSYEYEQTPTKIEQIPFSILKLQFPEKGVFNKTQSQISLQNILQKYIGKVGQKHQEGLRYAKIIQFPQYLILVYKRFINNGYTTQKDNSHLLYNLKLNIDSNNTRAHYRLLSQVCHIGDYQNGKYKIIFNIIQTSTTQNNESKYEEGKWFQIQDLDCKEVIEKQVLLGQPYIQMYRLVRLENREKGKAKEKVVGGQKNQEEIMRQ